jgi:hypothetical protein
MRARALFMVPLAVGAIAAVGLARSGERTVPAGAQATAPLVGPLLGIVSERRRGWLVRVDPDTLRPRRGARIDVGGEGCVPRSGGSACSFLPPWSVSPDRSRLALARHEAGVLRSLRLIDIRRLRVTADVRLKGGAIGLVAWPAPERLLAVQERCCNEEQQLLVVDLARRRVTATRPLRGTVVASDWTARELVLLVAPARRIGPARLAIVDAGGGIRFIELSSIAAGTKLVDSARHRTNYQTPGLALDRKARRAFVVAPELVATVDLASGAVSSDELEPTTSLLSRLRDWLEPVAYAKAGSGQTRAAQWLGSGLIAVTGTDESSAGEHRLRPAGLSLVDTRDWSMRTIDSGATEVRVAGDLLLATGSSPEATIGLVAYGLDGDKRFQLFEGREAWLGEVLDERAYVHLWDGRRERLHMVDIATGRARGERPRPLPRLVRDAAWSWWD